MTSVTGVIRLIRPINCAMMGFAVVVGEFIALSGSLPAFRALLGFPVAFLLTAATMILNDYYDRSIDQINNPERPIPSGAVSPRAPLALVFLLSTLGILASALVNSLAMIIALLITCLDGLLQYRWEENRVSWQYCGERLCLIAICFWRVRRPEYEAFVVDFCVRCAVFESWKGSHERYCGCCRR